MRKINFLIMLFIFITACGSDKGDATVDGNTTDNTLELTGVDSVDERDEPVEDPDAYVPPPPAIDSADIKRKKKSELSKEDCCASLEKIKKCCCDLILKKYEEYLKNKQYTEAGTLASKDPHYPACSSQHAYFEEEIIEIQKRVMGN